MLRKNLTDVYSAGNSIQKKYRQVTAAVADETITALIVIEFSNNFHKKN
jgi:hypothetical protein